MDISDTLNEDGTTTPINRWGKTGEESPGPGCYLIKVKASGDVASADMDALAKEVDENLSAVDTTFGEDDSLLDDKVKEAAKTLTDGTLYGEVVEGESGYYVVRMDSVLDREATEPGKREYCKPAETGNL